MENSLEGEGTFLTQERGQDPQLSVRCVSRPSERQMEDQGWNRSETAEKDQRLY